MLRIFFARPLLVTKILIMLGSLSVYGQHFTFSQFNFTPLKINPGIVASENIARASISSRNQQTISDLAFKSNYLAFSYPLISKKTKLRWGGVGISALDDRAIGAGEFINQSIALNLAYNIRIKSNMQVGLGLQASFNNQRFSTNGIQTGTQYRLGQYDPTLQPGENFNEVNVHNISLSSGFFFYDPDKEGRNRYYAGLSVFDFNRPNTSISGRNEHMPSILVLTAGYRLYKTTKFDLTPEILYTSVSGIRMLNVGGVASFNLKNITEAKSGRLDFSARYSTTKTGIVAMQFIKPKYFFGFSYDVSVSTDNNPKQNATEMVFGLKKTIKAKKKKKPRKKKAKKKKDKSKPDQKPPVTARKVIPKKNPVVTAQQSTPENAVSQVQGAVLESKEKLKEDSLRKARGTLRVHAALKDFEFEFNSTTINHASRAYLEDLAAFLKLNPDIKVVITGHTDNVGSTKINLKISEKRALIVKKYLEQKGIDETRIIAEGKGESEPLYPNETELERAKNRRVEFEFIDR